MHIVYWAHSYRDEDAAINRHFGVLIEEAERMIVNFDPPSKSVNESKLDPNLRSCDGMVAVLTWRANGPSQYILHEAGLCLRARKPLLVFVDDRLPSDLLPARILQRRFSSRTYFGRFVSMSTRSVSSRPLWETRRPRVTNRTRANEPAELVGVGAFDRASRYGCDTPGPMRRSSPVRRIPFLPLPACGEREGVKEAFQALPAFGMPLTRIALRSGLSPQAGRGKREKASR